MKKKNSNDARSANTPPIQDFSSRPVQNFQWQLTRFTENQNCILA